MPIKEAELVKFGMKRNQDDSKVFFPMTKKLNALSSEEGSVELVVTNERNDLELALKMPSGDTLYLGGCSTIEELEIFEKCITEWEANY